MARPGPPSRGSRRTARRTRSSTPSRTARPATSRSGSRRKATRGARAWPSPRRTGRAWTQAGGGDRVRPVSDPPSGGFVGINDVAAGDAVPGGPAVRRGGQRPGPLLGGRAHLQLADGRTWSRAPADPALGGVDSSASSDGREGWRRPATCTPAAHHPVIWVSRTGRPGHPWRMPTSPTPDRATCDAYMTDLAADGSGLVAVGGSSGLSEPHRRRGLGGRRTGRDRRRPCLPGRDRQPSPPRIDDPADRAACIGAVPVTVAGLARAEMNDCTEPERPPALSGCGGCSMLAPIETGPGCPPDLHRPVARRSVRHAARRPGS